MATSRFIGADERLTPAERRLLRAAGDRKDTVRGGGSIFKGALLLPRDEDVEGDMNTRTRVAIGRAVGKIVRLQAAAAQDVGDQELGQILSSRPEGVSEFLKKSFDRKTQTRDLEEDL